jgi:hypothetical protein
MADISAEQWNDIINLLEDISYNTQSDSQYWGPIRDMSQTAGQDALHSNSMNNGWQMGDNSRRRSARRERQYKSRNPLDQFEEGLTRGLLDAVAGGDFKRGMQSALNTFTKEFGVTLDEFPGELGKNLAKHALNSPLGKQITGSIHDAILGSDGKGGMLGNLVNLAGGDSAALGRAISNIGQSFVQGASGAGEAGSALVTAAGGATEATAAMSGLTEVIAGIASGPILPAIIAIGVALALLGPALEGLVDIAKNLGAAALRSDDEREKRMNNAQERLKKDLKFMAEEPFKILTDAAQEWYTAWDNHLHDISQIQGYEKESVYNLYSSYAERLRSEGLDSVISSTSIIDNLSKVLSSGLSGKAAEEFAYVATKLNNAIPNQDFFGYAASYAQIASSAISQGKSQEEALALANQQLETFASNLLYSSRELAGGFSTGLQNASQLFTDAVNIAQSAKSTNTAEISGVLTSVSAVIGAVAPDLANGLVQNIVQAAIGGNSDSIVALRSLAGINASNTEFLRAFASDPKSIFSALFDRLAELQNMSNDNFMEVAEGLAPIFGVDMAALARVDFNYLAETIAQMDVNQNSLEENMELLASGQSTTTAEQAKMKQINEMILNDGLAVVLDNEAARTIQQHMWDEQLANEIMQAEYAVNLQGSALQFLEGLSQSVHNIIRFLNPIGAIGELISNIAATTEDLTSQQAAIRDVVMNGAIKTNDTALANLTDYSGTSYIDVFGHPEGVDYNNRLAYMLFGDEGYHATSRLVSSTLGAFYNTLGAVAIPTGLPNTIVQGITNQSQSEHADSLTNFFARGASNAFNEIVSGGVSGLVNTVLHGNANNNSNSITSQYSWGKTSARILSAMTRRGTTYSYGGVDTIANDMAQQAADQFIESIRASIAETNTATYNAETNRYDKNMTSYEQWVQDFSRAQGAGFNYLDTLNRYNVTEEQIRGLFQQQQSITQSQVSEDRANAQSDFYVDGRKYFEESRAFWQYSNGNYSEQYWHNFYDDGMKFDVRMDSILAEMANIRDNYIGVPDKADTVRGLLNTINSTVISFNESFTDWVKDWTDYYINHTTYTARTQSADWAQMLYEENATTQNTALALANALEGISNIEDLKDPTVQSNVLLAKIVVILEAIMQQNNSAGGLSLIDTIGAMSLGLTNRT